MGTVIAFDIGRQRRHAPGDPGRTRRATLRVIIEAGLPEDPANGLASIHVSVSGGKAPVRLYLYVDGALADAWSDPQGIYDLPTDGVRPGRHAVTARVVDALGRWAGTSTVIECAPHTLPKQAG